MSKTAVWADNTTQDRLEADAKEHGWSVIESTSTKSVLLRDGKLLTIAFGTRERDGKIHTAITGWTLAASHWSTSKGFQLHNLIARYGYRKKATP